MLINTASLFWVFNSLHQFLLFLTLLSLLNPFSSVRFSLYWIYDLRREIYRRQKHFMFDELKAMDIIARDGPGSLYTSDSYGSIVYRTVRFTTHGTLIPFMNLRTLVLGSSTQTPTRADGKLKTFGTLFRASS